MITYPVYAAEMLSAVYTVVERNEFTADDLQGEVMSNWASEAPFEVGKFNMTLVKLVNEGLLARDGAVLSLPTAFNGTTMAAYTMIFNRLRKSGALRVSLDALLPLTLDYMPDLEERRDSASKLVANAFGSLQHTGYLNLDQGRVTFGSGQSASKLMGQQFLVKAVAAIYGNESPVEEDDIKAKLVPTVGWSPESEDTFYAALDHAGALGIIFGHSDRRFVAAGDGTAGKLMGSTLGFLAEQQAGIRLTSENILAELGGGDACTNEILFHNAMTNLLAAGYIDVKIDALGLEVYGLVVAL